MCLHTQCKPTCSLVMHLITGIGFDYSLFPVSSQNTSFIEACTSPTHLSLVRICLHACVCIWHVCVCMFVCLTHCASHNVCVWKCMLFSPNPCTVKLHILVWTISFASQMITHSFIGLCLKATHLQISCVLNGVDGGMGVVCFVAVPWVRAMLQYTLCKLCQQNEFFGSESCNNTHCVNSQHSKFFGSESCSNMHCANSVNTASSLVQNHAALLTVQTVNITNLLVQNHAALCIVQTLSA